MKYTYEEMKKLESQYGSPLYIFREDDFVRNYQDFLEKFISIYSKYQLSYSYKTNYTPAICKIVKDLGGYAEVVSDMEYTVARRLGYENAQIIYNGPYKGPLAEEHLLNGGILNIDNLQETERVCAIARSHPERCLEIGIRVNINIGQSFISRFGVDTDGEELDVVISKIKAEPNLKLAGMHCHIGQSRTIEAWSNRAEQMLALADKYFEQPPKYLDLGSGMFARMEPELAEQFCDDIPAFSDYANAVAAPLAKHYEKYPEKEKPVLFTEPGTTLINSYIDLIGKVDSLKYIKGRQFAVLNCSKDNIGDICKIKKLPIEILHASESQTRCTDMAFVGYTCLEHDVMYSGFFGDLSVNDFVVFANAGGYSNVSKPPFIAPNCAMIAKKDSGETRIIKRAESFEDIFMTYIF